MAGDRHPFVGGKNPARKGPRAGRPGTRTNGATLTLTAPAAQKCCFANQPENSSGEQLPARRTCILGSMSGEGKPPAASRSRSSALPRLYATRRTHAASPEPEVRGPDSFWNGEQMRKSRVLIKGSASEYNSTYAPDLLGAYGTCIRGTERGHTSKLDHRGSRPETQKGSRRTATSLPGRGRSQRPHRRAAG